MKKDWVAGFDYRLWLPADDASAEEARFVRRALRLRRGHRVLDAPCGAGRITVHLARAGCDVVGVDRLERFVRRARARFRREGVVGRFSVVDLRELDFEGEFHGVCNWFTSFGYCSDQVNFDILRRLTAALRPGGRLLIDQCNRERILRDFRSVEEREGVRIHNRWDPASQRIVGRWVVKDKGNRSEHASAIRLYTPAQMKRLFERAGLRVERFYGGPDGSVFGRSSRRMIVVGRKG